MNLTRDKRNVYRIACSCTDSALKNCTHKMNKMVSNASIISLDQGRRRGSFVSDAPDGDNIFRICFLSAKLAERH